MDIHQVFLVAEHTVFQVAQFPEFLADFLTVFQAAQFPEFLADFLTVFQAFLVQENWVFVPDLNNALFKFNI
jgi:hypothetical protein